MNKFSRVMPVFAMLLLSIVLAVGMYKHSKEKPVDDRRIGEKFTEFSVPMLWGGDKNFSQKYFFGQISVINIFASWCQGCLVEHQSLMRLAQTGKVKIYGIAWKDTPEKIKNYLRRNGNPFQLVGVDEKGDITVPLGLTGVPETFVVDKYGKIAFHYTSSLNDEVVQTQILPLLEKLKNE